MNGANQNIPNTLPRLPSFQQLSETIRNPDFPDLLQKLIINIINSIDFKIPPLTASL